MFYHSIEFWEHIMDIGVFYIFGFTILCLIISEIISGKKNASKKKSKKKKDFKENIKEQLDKIDSVQPLLQKNIHKKHQQIKQPEPIVDYASTVNSYDEASKMADLGMSIKAIGEKVKIPVCEIELIIKLKELVNESNKNNDGYAQALF